MLLFEHVLFELKIQKLMTMTIHNFIFRSSPTRNVNKKRSTSVILKATHEEHEMIELPMKA
jgi:hypothetical protein